MGKLFDLTQPEEDRSFQKEMDELGVVVERTNTKTAKALTEWISPGSSKVNHKFDISITPTHISVSPKWAKKIAGGKNKMKLAYRVVEYEGQKALLIKEDRVGFSFKCPGVDSRAWNNTLSPMLKEILEENGVKYGHYRLSIVKDGFLAALKDE